MPRSTVPPPPATVPGGRGSDGQVALVWMLGATQIIGYGTLYYGFAILAGPVAATFGWPVSWIFGAFSLALLLGGAAAPAVGGRVDRHGAAAVMAAGSLATAACLGLMAAAPGPVPFVLAMCLAQVASTMVTYDAAFAAIVQACGTSGRRRITHLTLVAGLASTLFWPVTTWLHGHLDWRGTLAVFAALNLLVCLPLHLIVARRHPLVRRDPGPVGEEDAGSVAGEVPPAAAGRALVLVGAGFALAGVPISALLAQMVPALQALGLEGSALLVSTLFGPAQVLVRFVNLTAGQGRHPLHVTILAMTLPPAAVLILTVTAPSVAGAALFAVMLGFGSGLKSIVQGTLPLVLFGSASYGARLGRLAMARLFLGAIAPFALAAGLEGLGTTASLLALVAVGVLGVAAFVGVARLRRPVPAG